MNYYNFTVKIIQEAGVLLMGFYNKKLEIRKKNNDPRDIVTEADLAISDFLSNKIKKEFGDSHSVYSEEKGGTALDSEYLWVLDPIDGTANFARAIPHFGISLGLMHQGAPIVGALFNPVTRELYSFEKGKGVFLNGKPIRVSEIDDLKDSAIFMLSGRKPQFWDWGSKLYRQLLEHANKTRNFASSGLDFCFVAAGKIEGVIYGQLTTMDIAAAIGIIHEAGGKVTDENGNPVVFSTEHQKIIASNGKIHEQLIRIVESL